NRSQRRVSARRSRRLSTGLVRRAELSTGVRPTLTRQRLSGQAGRMTYEGDASRELADVLSRHDGVLSVASAMKYVTRDALRWRVGSGRWQQPCRGIVVAQ